MATDAAAVAVDSGDEDDTLLLASTKPPPQAAESVAMATCTPATASILGLLCAFTALSIGSATSVVGALLIAGGASLVVDLGARGRALARWWFSGACLGMMVVAAAASLVVSSTPSPTPSPTAAIGLVPEVPAAEAHHPLPPPPPPPPPPEPSVSWKELCMQQLPNGQTLCPGLEARASCPALVDAAEAVLLGACPNVQSPAAAELSALRLRALHCQQRGRDNAFAKAPRSAPAVGHVATYASENWWKPRRCLEAPDAGVVPSGAAATALKMSSNSADGQGAAAKAEVRPNWSASSRTVPGFVQCVSNFASSFWHDTPANEATVTSLSAGHRYKVKTVSASRDPVDRFARSAAELLWRAADGRCVPARGDPAAGADPDVLEAPCDAAWLADAKATWSSASTWYPAMNASTGVPGIVAAFVDDAECQWRWEGAEYFLSQSDFLVAPGAQVGHVARLEDDVRTVEAKLAAYLNVPGHDSCQLGEGIGLPETSAIGPHIGDAAKSLLLASEALARRFCAVYAQDYVCLGYDLPVACVGLF